MKMFTAVLFITVKNWKLPVYANMGEWLQE